LFWEFTSRLEHLLPLFSAEEICLLQFIWENFRGSKLYAAATPLAKRCQVLAESAPPPGSLDHRIQVLQVVAAVLTLEFLNARAQRNAPTPGHDHLMRLFEDLSATELQTLSVEELAKKFCCSRRHLSRLFHHQFGCSVAALRMELRLVKAVSLLRDPSVKVITVAGQCGFNHLGLFNTCFKRRFGESPGQWRKSASVNAVEPALGPKGSRLLTQFAKPPGTANMNASFSALQAKGQLILHGIFPNGRGKPAVSYPARANINEA
jgi:AraC-like DNA-binding protein